MRFLHNTPFFLFFTGKGGVGKTSLACASAVHLADSGKRVLLVSTDPASNIAQVLQMAIGAQITAITAVERLHALEIDPLQSARIYRERVVAPVRGLLPEEVVKGIEEQLSGACTTEIAAFDEFTTLLTDPELENRFDHVLFDTAPTGHTVRLLQLPGAWSSFLENSQTGVSCLGPLAGLEKQRHRYRQALELLADGSRCRMILVARPQTSALKEVVRTAQELEAIGIACDHAVINGCLPAMTTSDPLANALREREQAALASFPAKAGGVVEQ
ncbi:TRC40/GET3/ArsA family transport-energizing ATPase, partial [Candidatus Magnetaquicoccus inordinatus]|uniref:TRC40/GET3/ArsA family transport-energizing ATPase n=1 Tax=Candidatus Magnetaquicoccus inordinatus TaxID=2496818 RepID=UPI0012923DAE